MSTRRRLALVLAFGGAVAAGLMGCVEPPASRLAAIDICESSPENALCDDGEPCTVDDQCKGGICIGIVAADGTLCTDGDVCTLADLCDKGRCKGTPAPDNYPCTDGDFCTVNDLCQGAKCIPGPPRVCVDNNFCTVDSCVSTLGCQFMTVGDCQPPPEAPDAAVERPDGATDGELPEVSDAPEDRPPPGDAPADAPDAAEETRPELAPETPPEPRPDAAVPVDTAPRIDLRAHGGACVCQAAGESAGSRGAGLLVAGLLLAAATRRRRRPDMRQGKPA